MRLRLGFALVIAAVVGGLAGPVHAQNYWKNSGTDWGTGANWSSGNVPTSSDDVVFNSQGAAAGTTSGFNPYASINQPSISGSQAAKSLTIAPNSALGNWSFTGSGSLTLGGASSTGITTYGPGTYTFNGPTLAGLDSTNTLALNVTNGSTLVLAGDTKITGNQGNINLLNGTLRLDNSSVNLTDRLTTAGTIKLQGGSVFELIGHSSGGTYNVGTYNTADNSVGGRNTIRITPNTTSAATTLVFANSGTFTLRQGTRNVTVFEATSGALGATNGPQIKFEGTPFVSSGSGSLLSNTATGATVGWAITSDSFGVNFATYNGTGTGGRGIISIANPDAGISITSGTDSTSGFTSAATNYQLDITSGTTVNSAAVTGASLRISPAAGATLAMGTNTLNVAALMIDGSNNFTITGTGNFGPGSGGRYIYVNNPNTTLSTSIVVGTGTNPTVFAGPGFIELTGTGLQNNVTAGNNARLTIVSGVLRASNSQFAFDTTRGAIGLVGGVLEITGGSNGTGSSADFRRALGTSGGNIYWFGGTSADQGSGGFSAFGANASVNIGGSSANLQWANGNFVGDGYALVFGSTKSNAVLTFENNIQLNNSSPAYQLREIKVIGGVGGDRTRITGEIFTTGGSADFLKTGTGILELANANGNNYSGNTFVHGGTLLISNGNTNSGTGTGNVTVSSGATFGGAGRIAGSIGGLSASRIQVGGSVVNTATTVDTNVTVANNSQLRVLVAQGSGASDTTNSGATRLNVAGAFGRSTTSDVINIVLTNDDSDALTEDGTVYTRRIATYGSLTNITENGGSGPGGSFVAADGVFTVTGSDFTVPSGYRVSVSGGNVDVIFGATPIPEPGTILGLAAGVLGLGAVVRRRLRRSPERSGV